MDWECLPHHFFPYSDIWVSWYPHIVHVISLPSTLLHVSNTTEWPLVHFKARGFQDQNAGPGAGWLVAARGSKKKDFVNFLPDEAFLSTKFLVYTTLSSKSLKYANKWWKLLACSVHIDNMTPNWYPCELGYLFQHCTYLQIISIILHLTCVKLEQAPRNWVFNVCQSLWRGKADEMIS